MTSGEAWWVCANEQKAGGGWHWNTFFKQDIEPGPYAWGGCDWIQSAVSFARIREMRRGDLIFAYQAAEGLVGLTRLASDGHSCHGGKSTDAFDLDPNMRLWFTRSIPMKVIRDLPESSVEVEAVRMSQGTVYAVTSKGVALLAAAIGEANPGQAEDVYGFIRLSPSAHE